MDPSYIIVSKYGTCDGNMGQINNKVLTYDKSFLIVKNYVEDFTKACTLRNSIVDIHYNNICLKNWLQILTKFDFFLAFSAIMRTSFQFCA